MLPAPDGYRDRMTELEGSPMYEEAKAAKPMASSVRPEVDGVPAEEDLSSADVEERLDDEPEEAVNRSDVSDDPDDQHPR